jgi:Ran GTPase-activating protein (RanGAP) involved in mRNA processing and transport
MSDNEDDFHNHYTYDYGCVCNECVNRGGDELSDDDDDNYDTPASSVPRLCAQLRTNDPSVLPHGPTEVFEPDVPDSCRLEIAEALAQNTIVRRIRLDLKHYSNLSADAMAKYLVQSKRLLHVELVLDHNSFHRQFLSIFIEAVGQSNSVKELNLTCPGFGTASESFENLLTRTKTLRHLRVDLKRRGPLEEEETAAIASGFSKNTTLREIVLIEWQETSLIPVLTALRDHPVLEKLHVLGITSFTGLDALLRGKNSQLKELIIEGINNGSNIYNVEQVVGFESFMQVIGRNTTILNMVIANVPLSRDNVQQLKAMLRRNTVLQDLDLTGDAFGSAGLAEVASALYRNTSIQGLSLSLNGLDDLAAANALRELLRRNKTITRLKLEGNAFGRNVAAVRCIADGFRTNKTLQELDLSFCGLDDQGISILAEGLGQQKRGLVKLSLFANQITCTGLRALVDNATAALSTVTDLDLSTIRLFDEGATLLAETLRLQTLPSLKRLCLFDCHISGDGLVTLMSALEETETLLYLDLEDNDFGVPGYLALASSLPNIKGLQQIDFHLTTSDPSVVSGLLEGFRENTSLHEVNILGGENVTWSQELSFLLYRNKFSRLIQDSDTDDRASLGLWPRALGCVAMFPDVLFHVLTSKADLIRATPGEDSKKRKRDDSE